MNAALTPPRKRKAPSLSPKPTKVTLNLLPDDGKPKPLSINFHIELEADDPRMDRIFPALGEFLAVILSEEEARDFLRQYEKEYKRVGAIGQSKKGKHDAR